MRNQSKKISQQPAARENAVKQDATGFSFKFDWLIKWRDFFGPIIERRKAKPKQFPIKFNSQLTVAPKTNCMWLDEFW